MGVRMGIGSIKASVVFISWFGAVGLIVGRRRQNVRAALSLALDLRCPCRQ